MSWSFLEFFAGGGLARAGLGPGWRCLLANDIDSKKAATYRENWGAQSLIEGDVTNLDPSLVRERPNLAWASFPCQDVSQAGAGAGLKGLQSGTFWPFWRFIEALAPSGRNPDMIVLENVCGMVTSHGGADLDAICTAMNESEYRVGALVIDASLFLPQSRPRVFVIAIRRGLTIPVALISKTPKYFHTDAIQKFAAECLSMDISDWLWWNPPPPNNDVEPISSVLDKAPSAIYWHEHEKTCSILKLMSAHTLMKVSQIRRSGRPVVGTIYKRMRPSKHGGKVQRAEVRFDGISGCLRAPTGGSSRQILLFVEGNTIRSRLLSSREAARLMGLPDSYILPAKEYDSYRVSGEGVAVPVVRFLAATLLEPLLEANSQRPRSAKQTEKEIAPA